jgi:quercetin dioxygenase-like cupin family protein
MRPAALSLLLISFLLTSCQTSRSRIFTVEGIQEDIQWTSEEKIKDIDIRRVRATDNASIHIVRLNTAEKLHIHEHHDASVVVLSGKVGMILGNQKFILERGDVLEITRGTVHKAENLAGNASEAYVVFTPPYDGKDMKVIERT